MQRNVQCLWKVCRTKHKEELQNYQATHQYKSVLIYCAGNTKIHRSWSVAEYIQGAEHRWVTARMSIRYTNAICGQEREIQERGTGVGPETWTKTKMSP